MKKRRAAALLALSLALALAACGTGEETAPTQSAAPPSPTGAQEDVTAYDLDGLTFEIPNELADRLLVFTDRGGGLISVYEKRSYEESVAEYGDEASGAGFLFSILRYDQVEYEQEYLRCNGGAGGLDFFARDGAWYYGWGTATDVQFYRAGGVIDTDSQDWAEWEALYGRFDELKADFIARNDLEPYDGAADLARDFLWESGHVYVNYHSADWSASMTLILSQPARQGEGGVWCVEQWIDNNYGGSYWALPETELTAADYFAQVQAGADGETAPELLTPEGAALAWLREYFGDTSIQADSLRLVEGEPGGNVWGRLSAVMGEEPCTLAAGVYRGGALTEAQFFEEPDYYRNEDQNLSLLAVAGPSLYPLVWVKAEPSVDWYAVQIVNGAGGRITFLSEVNKIRIEEDGRDEWFAPAYDYERGPYERMYSICREWAEYASNMTDEELEQAKEAVISVFQGFSGGCTLEALDYDPISSAAQIKSYMRSGHGRVNGVSEDNVLVLASRFTTGGEEEVRGTGFEPDTTCFWMFILIREGPGEPWVVDDWGY